jgi:small conductance mechanosensitive channel
MKTMQADPGWGAELIGEPDILGIEQFEQDGILLKIRIQTQPGQQFNVTREFRFRLNQGFKTAGIKIPIPQREVRYRTSAQDYPGQSENL